MIDLSDEKKIYFLIQFFQAQSTSFKQFVLKIVFASHSKNTKGHLIFIFFELEKNNFCSQELSQSCFFVSANSMVVWQLFNFQKFVFCKIVF